MPLTAATKSHALLRLARKGPVRARDLDDANIPRTYLRRLVERGLLEQVDRGLYKLADAPVSGLHSLAEVAKRVPHGTVCLLSALQVHGLTGEVPHAVWLQIARHARTPRMLVRRSASACCASPGNGARSSNSSSFATSTSDCSSGWPAHATARVSC
jgi:predicted transcriptional regulator of viral defense system